MGYWVVLNHYNQCEVWSGTGTTNPDTEPEGICGIADASSWMESCSDVLYVLKGNGLPCGLWAVSQGPAFDLASTTWSHVTTIVRAANGEIEKDLLNHKTCYNMSMGLQWCGGTWSLYMNGVLEEYVMSTYSSANAGDLLIGASELTTPSANGVVAQFAGFVDEVAVYGCELSMKISDHYRFGTSQEQPDWVSMKLDTVSYTL